MMEWPCGMMTIINCVSIKKSKKVKIVVGLKVLSSAIGTPSSPQA
jgi:hypothetical protein